MTYTRNCPSCNCILTYNQKKICLASERKGSVCRSCRNKQRKYPTGEEHAGWGKEMSLETRRKMSISKGGNGELAKFNRGQMHRWAKQVIERDVCCQKCSSTENLHAHHIIQKALFPDLAYVLGNGLTLCSVCHYEIHKLIGKPRFLSKRRIK
jgi:5-methylcytosine-specific restriction endonuclease McrA